VVRSWTVGIDVGGTFTDVVATDQRSGAVRTAKTLTRVRDPIGGIETACHSVALAMDDISDLILGTTMATNAIVEGRLAKTALIATAGFADTLDIGRQNRRELYRMDITPRPEPLVPPDLRLEAAERVDAEGRTVAALEDREAIRLAEAAKTLGVEAVAVCLLHSYVNGRHEIRIGEELRRKTPFVALSHELNPEPREFERMNSTILNAALMPTVARYLRRLEDRLGEGTRLHLFHSAGGMAAAASVETRPLSIALSGPAAGVAAAARVASQLQLPAVIAFDMGGTTTDVSIVVDGKAQIGSNHRLAGYPIRQMQVGDPGPACYGLGGTQPTVTDANLVLGYLDAERVLGGTVRLDAQRAAASLSSVARAVGASIYEAALGIHRVANANMVRALRRVTVESGVDARACALLAFGGAGPMHAVALAREFGISRVIVPRYSSAFSALGCLVADMRYAEQRSLRMAGSSWDSARLAQVVDGIATRLATPLPKSGHDGDGLKVDVVGLVRYREQSDTVEVPLMAPYDPSAISTAFEAAHRRLYGFATDEAWDLEAVRVTVSAGANRPLSPVSPAAASRSPKPSRRAPCWFEAGGPAATSFYDREALVPDERIAGPAIIEDPWSTVVVPPGATAWADRHANLQIATMEAAR